MTHTDKTSKWNDLEIGIDPIMDNEVRITQGHCPDFRQTVWLTKEQIPSVYKKLRALHLELMGEAE